MRQAEHYIPMEMQGCSSGTFGWSLLLSAALDGNLQECILCPNKDCPLGFQALQYSKVVCLSETARQAKSLCVHRHR